MLSTVLLAFLASHVTEVVVAINKRLNGTLLQGSAAFLLALGVAFVGALIDVFFVMGVPLPSLADFSTWATIAPTFTEVWTVMQIYFLLVVQQLGLDVGQNTDVGGTPAPAASSGV
jgi:hypothetical protein